MKLVNVKYFFVFLFQVVLSSNAPYIALLINPDTSNRYCVGVVIASQWIIGNCPIDYGNYTIVKVGWLYGHESIYEIEKYVPHYNYSTFEFDIEDYDTSNLYAALDSVFLYKTSRKIKIIPGAVEIAILNANVCFPKKIQAVFLYDNWLMIENMYISSRTRCNDHFHSYFQKEFYLPKTQLCLLPKTVSSIECCYSQAIFIAKNAIIGLTAWSTGCWDTLEIDPWVISDLSRYINWIKMHCDPFLSYNLWDAKDN